jgi:hypothetical protein
MGVGINDSTTPVTRCNYIIGRCGIKKPGKAWTCPFYKKWASMINRCYSKTYKADNPRYHGVTVCEEWLRFSTFKAWVLSQDHEGRQIIRTEGSSVYSPDTCTFIDIIKKKGKK